MEEKFSNLIHSNFKKNQGWLIGVISLITSILLWIITPSTVVPFGLILTLLILAFFLMYIFADSGHEIFNKYLNLIHKTKLPRLIRVIEREGKQILLARPSQLFSHDMVVSIYLVDNDKFEELIGFGFIINVQEDGILQIELIKILESFKDGFEKMIANDIKILENVIIKPHLSIKFIDMLREEE